MPLKRKSTGSAKKKKTSKSAAPKFTAQIGDGTVQGQKLQAEFLKKANDWIFKNTSRAIDLFRSFDTNGDGVLSHEEFRSGMARLKAPFTKEEVEAVIKLIDTDGSGDLDYHEFQHGIRYRVQQSQGDSGDGLPPLMLFRQPQELCSHCGLGLWNPQASDTRYVRLEVKLLPFCERSHPAHFTFTVCLNITIYGIAQLVNKQLGGTAIDLTIYRFPEASDESELEPGSNLSLCDFEGGSRLHPKPALLYYDYMPALSDCAVIMSEHYFTHKRTSKKTHSS